MRIELRVGVAMVQPMDPDPPLGMNPAVYLHEAIEKRSQHRMDPKGPVGEAAVAVDLGDEAGENARDQTNEYSDRHTENLVCPGGRSGSASISASLIFTGRIPLGVSFSSDAKPRLGVVAAINSMIVR